MSLVGSLEDLGLGDILQIISLSGKSGLLWLRSESGGGRILFDQGRIRTAFLGETPPRLDPGCSEEDAQDRLREQVEQSVMQMFGFATGEFSFEICDVRQHADPDHFLEPGLNPQYLALEGTRIADERSMGLGAAEPMIGEAVVVADPADEVRADLVEEMIEGELLEPAACARTPAEPTPSGVAAREAAPAAASQQAPSPALVLVDPDLAVVEWVRAHLPDALPKAHLFQATDQGVNRIRQYLRRAEIPVVVLATELPPDALSLARGVEDLLRRLHRQAPSMPLLLLEEQGRPLPPPLERLGLHRGRLSKPTASQLADPRQQGTRDRLGQELAAQILELCGLDRRPEGPAVEELREISARLQAASGEGEVLPVVLEFATRSFSRVALFLIRDGEAQGLAQLGLPAAGGPDDVGIRSVVLGVEECGWLRKVVETRAPLRLRLEGAPPEAGDARLLTQLGADLPPELWIAPIVGADQVVAVLYGDRLPGCEPVGDTAGLEVVLHHAGLALDRAALERALEAQPV